MNDLGVFARDNHLAREAAEILFQIENSFAESRLQSWKFHLTIA